MTQTPKDSTLLAGFRVLGVGIRREPWVFTLSTLGSVLFGALTVADAWVLGWSTDHVLLPAFDTGTTTNGGLVAILLHLPWVVALVTGDRWSWAGVGASDPDRILAPGPVGVRGHRSPRKP